MLLRLLIPLFLLLVLTSGVSCDLLPTINTSSNTTTTTTSSASPIKPGFTLTLPPGQIGSTGVLPSVADVVAMVKPTVVAINVEVETTDIFGRVYTEEGAGSGWVIDSNGIIVTNNHVVEGASRVTVVLDDGRSFEADTKKIATDALADLAVIKINATNLNAAKVGDSSQLRVGDWVVAIGNSLGQGIRATVGIVSQQSVSIEVETGQTLSGLVETDAAINPGNSGGPLVNMAGEVIGINSVKIAEVGVEGVGYAIGTVEATPILQQLINAGYVTRPFLGITSKYIDIFSMAKYSLAVNEGALIDYIQAGSPADTAGLRVGDVITRFNGKDISEPQELLTAIHQAQIGQSVEITYWRGQTQYSTSAVLVTNSPTSP